MNIKIYLHEIGWIILIRKSGFLWLLFAFFWIGLLSACDSEKLSQDNQVIQAVNTTIIGSKSPSTVTVGSVTPTLSLTTSIVTTTGTPTISQNRNNSRLNGISCRAPCWEDITPGKTSLDEAIKLLEKNPYVIFNSIKIEPPPSSTVNPKSGFLVWKWNDGSIQQSRITYDYQNLAHTVKIIYLAMFEAKLGDINKATPPQATGY